MVKKKFHQSNKKTNKYRKEIKNYAIREAVLEWEAKNNNRLSDVLDKR